MKFKIIGISNDKLLVSLKKLCNAFILNNEFVNDDANYEVYIAIIIFSDKIKVVIKCDNNDFEYIQKINNLEYDLKYTVLACFYLLLRNITNNDLPWGVLTGIRPSKLVHKYISDGLTSKQITSILRDKYMVSLEKANLLVDIANYQRKVLNFEQIKKEVSIYINIPFCLSKCSYCSFTSYNLNYKFVSVKEYLDKLYEEIKMIGALLKENMINITSIYIGGGTPTALVDSDLESLLEAIDNYLFTESVKEYTIECGRPDSLTLTKYKIIKKHKVSRISINPQTFNNETLKKIKRNHKASDIIEKYQIAKDLGFNNINMDLIIGLIDEKLYDIKTSVDKTLELFPESITVHSLALKKGANKKMNVNDLSKDVRGMFNYAHQEIIKANYVPYYLYRQKNIVGNLENIGYSKRGYESIYNIIMIEELQCVVGLGCGASSKFTNNELVLNPKDLISYTKSYKEYLNKKLMYLNKYLGKKD